VKVKPLPFYLEDQMRHYSKTVISTGLIVFIFGTLMAASLMFPAGTSAHPAFGFTPTPTPTGNNGRDDGDSAPPTATPPDYVLVRLEQCNLTCLELYSQLGDPANLLAAAPSADPDFNPLAMLDQANITMEVQVPVQIVHQGSGFIVDQILSDAGPTRIPVPYPGQWQVFFTGNPQLVTATAVDVSRTNLADLSASLAAGPVPVAMVEADTAEPQLIKCPVVCVIEAPPLPQPEGPPFLPETGQADMSPGMALLVMGASLLAMGLLAAVILWRGQATDPNAPRDHSSSEQ
jgi:hypothetical protein